MKVTAHGPYGTFWPDGGLFSPAPDTLVEVDDADTAKVAFLRALADAGLATILEDVPAEPDPADLRARAATLGIMVDGRWSGKRLAQEIAKAEQ